MESKNDENKISQFNLNDLCFFLDKNTSFIRIAFQFNKDNLKYASYIKNFVITNTNQDIKRYLFFLGESSYGDCCVDEITSLHLTPDLIIRVGESCMTNPKNLPVYYLFENSSLPDKVLERLVILINEIKDKKVFLYYNIKYNNVLKPYFEQSNIFLPIYNENRTSKIKLINIYYEQVNQLNNEDSISITDPEMIIIFNIDDNFSNEAYSHEFIMRYSKQSLIKCLDINISKETVELNEFNHNAINRVFTKRFNLSLKANESKTFGILVGNLNIPNVNNILLKLKQLLIKKNKKYYTFLLGKITDDKLSNYIEYIDCFILIACTCNSFIDRKALMKPIVCPIDLLFAFDEKKWDLSYSFDPNYFNSENVSYVEREKINSEIQSEALSILDKDENKALSLVFGNDVLSHFNNRNFKGLEVNKGKEIVKEIKKGKRGLPIKYESIDS